MYVCASEFVCVGMCVSVCADLCHHVSVYVCHFLNVFVCVCPCMIGFELWSPSFSTVQDGATPLYIASHNGHTDVCTALLAAKASVDAAAQVSL